MLDSDMILDVLKEVLVDMNTHKAVAKKYKISPQVISKIVKKNKEEIGYLDSVMKKAESCD